MALKLMYITNDPEIAKIAENSGVDWIFVDLEVRGKAERQGHLDTVMSKHSIDDIKEVKKSLKKAKLLVRVNPLFENSKLEIEEVIAAGADIIMFPFFTTKEEVNAFIDYVDGRVKTCLLLETPKAVEALDDILNIKGIDYIHIGLNDLHLGYGMDFMFETLADGKVERICHKVQEKGIPVGFGGIARLGLGHLPAEMVVAEHYRIGSEMVILSRSFCNVAEINDIAEIKDIFRLGVNELRDYEKSLEDKDETFFIENQKLVKTKVKEVAQIIRNKKLEKVK